MARFSFYEEPPKDRELTAEVVREVVREQFPELAVATIERLGDGWEHETYLVDDRVVFRFPRRAGSGDDFAGEEGVHALVSSVIGDLVGIPRITRWGRPSARFPHPFAGHDVIPGIAANDPLAPVNPALAEDVGRVLARLHAIPAEAAVAAGAGSAWLDKADLAAGLARVRYVVNELPEIRRHFPDPCTWLDSALRVPDAYRGPPRFIHDDFQMEHVLVSRATGRLSGIIDWGGGLGDPMRDFSYVLIHGGWSFFQRALDAYDLPLDPEFAERTLFSARLGSLHYLGYTITHGGSTSRDLAGVRRVFELG
jgi:aminoglycoside phosphotransferase (APT) family kinase protein